MNRVVVSGMGVLAPNGHGLDSFEAALRQGVSGIRYVDELADHGFACRVGGIPHDVIGIAETYLPAEALNRMNTSMLYAAIAGIDCWRDAGFRVPEPGCGEVDWETGAVVGSGLGGVDTLAGKVIPLVDSGKVRRLGSLMTEQIMNSAASACLGGLLGLGGPLTSNSSACATGTEAVINAFQLVRSGRVKRMLAGGVEGYSRYAWGVFDSMHLLARGFNDRPAEASRPMSATANGFVPAAGAGLLMVESMESAMERGTHIYGEILGGFLNSGGQRNGGSITAPNSEGVRRCIRGALDDALIGPETIDLINGHLTATSADTAEVMNWQAALDRSPERMPWINAAKSLIGHALGGAGGIECVASLLQLDRSFVHGSLNCDDLHQELEPFAARVPLRSMPMDIHVVAKASFGFGDVNGCLVIRKWEQENRN